MAATRASGSKKKSTTAKKSSTTSKSKSSGGKSAGGKKTAHGSNKRELIAPRGDKRYVKRNAKGEFKESDDVSRSLSQDRKRTSKKTVKPGYGDQGDQKKRSRSKK